MNYKILEREDIYVDFSVEHSSVFFRQEVLGVVDAVTWFLRISPRHVSIMYWAAYSTCSKELLDACSVPTLTLPNQEHLDYVDAQWRMLTKDPVSEMEQRLEPEYVRGQ